MRADDLHPGSVLAGHRIEALVNSGGMGLVFRAVDTELDREVALKVIKPELADDEQFRTRFQREARLVANIEHPNIIKIWRCGEEEGLLYVSMQYIDGSDLGEVITGEGRLPPIRAARIVADVAAALDVAHRHGVVHRDIKPQNILLERSADDERVVLTDFGLAKRMTKSRAERFKTMQFVGTPPYAAPELMRPKHVDARADVYGLACVLFHCVTGRLPFVADYQFGFLIAHATTPPPRITEIASDLPQAFDPVVDRALAKRPDQRYESAGDFAQAVLSAADQGVIATEPVGSVATGDAAPRAEVVSADSPPPASGGSSPTIEARVNEILRRAESHRTRRRFESAIEEFERALDLTPLSTDARAGRGHALLDVRKLDAALSDFEAALVADPTSVYALNGRGAVKLARRLDIEALDDFALALTIDPGSLEALLGYAEALARLRRYSEARAAVDSALAIDADAVEALRLQAILALQGRRLDAAMGAANRAVEVEPHAGRPYATRAFVRLVGNDQSGALEDLETAIAHDENDASSLALRGIVLARQGSDDEGLQDLDRAIEADPGYAEAHAFKAAVTLWLEREGPVDDWIGHALELDPRCGSAHVARALQHLAAGRPKKALTALDRGIQLDRVGVMAWFGKDRMYVWRARMAHALGRYTEAVADSGRALKESPSSLDAHLIRGRALLALGRAEQALEDFDAARAQAPGSVDALVARAQALFALGRHVVALTAFDAAVARAPDSQMALEARVDAARRLPLPPAVAERTEADFRELEAALEARELERADKASIAIVRSAAGEDVIDSESKALGLDDAVLLKLDAYWRAKGLGSARKRPWLRLPELTTTRRLLRLQSWLSWRMREATLERP